MEELFSGVFCGFGRVKSQKEQFQEWRKQMRQQVRQQDRQIRKIEWEQQGVKRSIKQAAKRGDLDSARVLAREVVRSKRAVERCHTTKAMMNSVMMQIQQQIAQQRAVSAIEKSTVIAQQMNKLVHVFEVRETMLAMEQEMIKVCGRAGPAGPASLLGSV